MSLSPRRPQHADKLLHAALDASGPDEAVRLAVRWLLDAANEAGVDPTPSLKAERTQPSELSMRSAEIAWVYYAQRPDGTIKIGVAGGQEGTTDIHDRLRIISKEKGYSLKLLAAERGYWELEGRLHDRFRDLDIGGEWHRPGPELLAHIDQLVERLRTDTSWHGTRWAYLLEHYPWFTEDMKHRWRRPRELSQTATARAARRRPAAERERRNPPHSAT